MNDDLLNQSQRERRDHLGKMTKFGIELFCHPVEVNGHRLMLKQQRAGLFFTQTLAFVQIIRELKELKALE